MIDPRFLIEVCRIQVTIHQRVSSITFFRSGDSMPPSPCAFAERGKSCIPFVLLLAYDDEPSTTCRPLVLKICDGNVYFAGERIIQPDFPPVDLPNHDSVHGRYRIFSLRNNQGNRIDLLGG